MKIILVIILDDCKDTEMYERENMSRIILSVEPGNRGVILVFDDKGNTSRQLRLKVVNYIHEGLQMFDRVLKLSLMH